MYICVDFDGTIVDHVFPKIGQPAPGAIFWMKEFIGHKAHIILNTMRSDGQDVGDVLTEAVNFLVEKDIHLFGINKNPTQDRWTTSPKVYGNIYIDDAAYGCPMIHPVGFSRPCVDWSIVGPSVVEMIKGKQANG